MKCKFCQQELEDGVTLCPECGRENAEEIEEVAAEAAENAPVEHTGEPVKPTMSKMALALGILVALVVLLAAMIMGSREKPDVALTTPDPTVTTTELTEGTEPTEPPTTPADTGLNDPTCKGTYTVADDVLLAGMDTVIATMGEEVMTVADLQVYYWMQVREFMSSEDFYYLCYYYGAIDPALPLDAQICAYEETLTWQQYFVRLSIEAWQEFTGVAIAAKENNTEMQADLRAELDGMQASLEELALSNGFADVQEVLEYNMGPGATYEAYEKYLEVYYLGYSYYAQQYELQTPTEEEVNAHFEENLAYFKENGVTKEIKTIDVRHVLIQPEGGLETATEEAWAAAEAEAQALLDAWVAGGATEEAFGEMAKEHTADGNGADGGLYTGVTEGYMVAEFNDWCFDETRQIGDYGLVKTQFGWHIMFFSGSAVVPNDNWYTSVESDLLYDRIETMMDAAIHKYELVTEYSSVMLGYVDLMA